MSALDLLWLCITRLGCVAATVLAFCSDVPAPFAGDVFGVTPDLGVAVAVGHVVTLVSFIVTPTTTVDDVEVPAVDAVEVPAVAAPTVPVMLGTSSFLLALRYNK